MADTINLKKNDIVVCYLTGRNSYNGRFYVSVKNMGYHGFLPVKPSERRLGELEEALQTNREIPLYYVRSTIDGRCIFSLDMVKGNNANSSAVEKSSVEQPVDDSASMINISIPSSNNEYNKKVFEALINTIDVIDTDEKYALAKQLILLNRNDKYVQGLSLILFSKSKPIYQNRFWDENILPFCNNNGVKLLWSKADTEGKNTILKRLGITLPPQEVKVVEKVVEKEVEKIVEKQIPGCSVIPFFDNIAEEVIRQLKAAQESIHIAMAWFTNYDIFKTIKEILKEKKDVKVVLLTNNDLINNGGYCLNFNELIAEGLELHLAEYPDMIHHKFCIIDHSVVINGSYNWTFLAEDENLENIVVIKDAPEVALRFENEFDVLLQQFSKIYDHMPEEVPDKPEYDRGSFKQYISEELVARSHRNIGDAKENIRRARDLAPTNPRVVKAVQNYHLDENNSTRTIEELDQEAVNTGIRQRQEQQVHLQNQQEHIERQMAELNTRQKNIQQQQQRAAEQAEQRVQAATSEAERNQIREQAHVQQQQFIAQQRQVQQARTTARQQQATVAQAIQNTRHEIETIQKTATTQTAGGRGKLKINLKWFTTDDLDLHVIDPSGFEIYYAKKQNTCQGVLGQLDIDANASVPFTTTPQENIYWEDKAPIGDYEVKVHWYAKRSGVPNVPFTVTVYPEKGETRNSPGTVTYEKESITVFRFSITENGIVYKFDMSNR